MWVSDSRAMNDTPSTLETVAGRKKMEQVDRDFLLDVAKGIRQWDKTIRNLRSKLTKAHGDTPGGRPVEDRMLEMADEIEDPLVCRQPGYGAPGITHCAACCGGRGVIVSCEEDDAIVEAADALRKAARLIKKAQKEAGKNSIPNIDIGVQRLLILNHAGDQEEAQDLAEAIRHNRSVSDSHDVAEFIRQQALDLHVVKETALGLLVRIERLQEAAE